MCRSAIKKKNHRFLGVTRPIATIAQLSAMILIRTIDKYFFLFFIYIFIFVCLFVSFIYFNSRTMVKFLSDTKRITRLLLPWRPCLDSKLWTKSRSDINRAFGTQIISRPESCLCLNNNVNRKKVRQRKIANGKENERGCFV